MTINRLTKTAWYSLQNIYIYIKKKRNWNIHDTTITPKIYQSSKYLKQTCNSQFTIWQKKKKKFLSRNSKHSRRQQYRAPFSLILLISRSIFFFPSLARPIPDTEKKRREGNERANERLKKMAVIDGDGLRTGAMKPAASSHGQRQLYRKAATNCRRGMSYRAPPTG